MAQVQSIENQIFGSFFLANSEFAVSVSYVQEVVNAPDVLTVVPLAPSYLKGLFNLRGTIIPVLDLRQLLGLDSGDIGAPQKVAIIELEGVCVGLLFDKTGEVFKDSGDERSDFISDAADGVVGGVFKKNAGKRIIQILNVNKLFKLQSVPKDAGGTRMGREARMHRRGARKQCISFVVGPARCALSISAIQEILKIEKLSEPALAVGHCIGTIDLRGATVPIVDFASLLNYRPMDRTEAATSGDRRIVVMRLENELFGLMVDSVDSIISYFDDELLQFPVIEQQRGSMFSGCITNRGEGDILLLDHLKILSSSEVSEITRGHSRLYQSRNSKTQTASAGSGGGSRGTYITFKIDGTYAVSISEVKEIIEYPRELLQPPGLRPHVRGVLNLRGELVTIIDAHLLYSNNESNLPRERQKVLVFKRGDVHFGLVVDSVESIISFSSNDKIKLPPILYKKDDGGISADISEAVEVTSHTGAKANLLILSPDAIVARAA
ncbi:MAG: chemotaxis protein CheW [Bdellovibrionaceae bacterium]|nr:chemotaxis protein CheW [Pseudobdellovibrionaceae bacterium]